MCDLDAAHQTDHLHRMSQYVGQRQEHQGARSLHAHDLRGEGEDVHGALNEVAVGDLGALGPAGGAGGVDQ